MPSVRCSRPNGALEMFYQTAGNGSPPVVLVHGFGCDHTDWRHQVQDLASDHTTITVDLAGHGQSRPSPGPHRVEQLGSDVATLLNELDLTNAYLVGHSMGCRVVMQAWREARERVRGLVFVDGSWIGRGADAAALEADAYREMSGSHFNGVTRGLFEDMFLANSIVEDPEAIVARALALEPDAGATLFASVVGWDARHTEETLTAFDGELLIMQSTYLNAERQRVALGSGDSTPWLDLVRTTVPSAKVDIIPDVGHFTMLEAPAQVTALISEFTR